MSPEVFQELCRGCMKKDTCEYIPTDGVLIRCLDKQPMPQEEDDDEYRMSEEDSFDAI
jgi:hypothetical protein